MKEDENYCSWPSENVIGKDFNTLKILDYIHKSSIRDKSYTDKIKTNVLTDILSKYIPSNWHEVIDKEEILGTKRYKDCPFDDTYMTDWEETMYDIIDYGDLC